MDSCMFQQAGVDSFQRAKMVTKKKPLDGPLVRSFISRAWLYFTSASSTHKAHRLQTPVMSTVVRPVGAGTPAKPHPARGQNHWPIVHIMHPRYWPLFLLHRKQITRLRRTKLGGCLLVVIVSRYTADCLGLTLDRAVDLDESSNDTFPQGSEYLIILRLIMRHCDHGTF